MSTAVIVAKAAVAVRSQALPPDPETHRRPADYRRVSRLSPADDPVAIYVDRHPVPIGPRSRGYRPQAGPVALRRYAEEAAVLAAGRRRAFRGRPVVRRSPHQCGRRGAAGLPPAIAVSPNIPAVSSPSRASSGYGRPRDSCMPSDRPESPGFAVDEPWDLPHNAAFHANTSSAYPRARRDRGAIQGMRTPPEDAEGAGDTGGEAAREMAGASGDRRASRCRCRRIPRGPW